MIGQRKPRLQITSATNRKVLSYFLFPFARINLLGFTVTTFLLGRNDRTQTSLAATCQHVSHIRVKDVLAVPYATHYSTDYK